MLSKKRCAVFVDLVKRAEKPPNQRMSEMLKRPRDHNSMRLANDGRVDLKVSVDDGGS